MSHARELMVIPFLGEAIAQIRSPALINALFARYNKNCLVVPLKVPPTEFVRVAPSLLAVTNVCGIMLTNPHKASALALADHVDLSTQLAGGANALRLTPQGNIEGAMFDGVGLVKALRHWDVPLDGRRVLIVGCGRAGRAVAAELAKCSLNTLALFDPSCVSLAEFSSALNVQMQTTVQVLRKLDLEAFDLVINATALGTKADDPLPFDVSKLTPQAIVVDVVITRHATPLLEACRRRGITAYSGHEMLTQQIPEYLRFLGMPDLATQAERDFDFIRQLFDVPRDEDVK